MPRYAKPKERQDFYTIFSRLKCLLSLDSPRTIFENHVQTLACADLEAPRGHANMGSVES